MEGGPGSSPGKKIKLKPIASISRHLNWCHFSVTAMKGCFVSAKKHDRGQGFATFALSCYHRSLLQCAPKKKAEKVGRPQPPQPPRL